ncbi:hypothetical protein N8D56_21255 [Devosia sp. A8/3-2]|nr:hypothetical protein N8D56_21255 [Devosia sp. A8/3-2]
MALDILKERPIASLNDARPTAEWLKRNFAVTRDACSAMANWNFATKRASIPAEVTVPAFGWSKAYTLPTDCLRLIALTYDGYDETNPIRHIVEGGAVLTNQSGPLPIRYVARVENYNVYSALFVEALSARLAFKMAHWVTGKTSYQQVAKGIYDRAMSDARLSDAIEGDQPRPADNDWIDARY